MMAPVAAFNERCYRLDFVSPVRFQQSTVKVAIKNYTTRRKRRGKPHAAKHLAPAAQCAPARLDRRNGAAAFSTGILFLGILSALVGMALAPATQPHADF
jgi:hypothetical protein